MNRLLKKAIVAITLVVFMTGCAQTSNPEGAEPVEVPPAAAEKDPLEMTKPADEVDLEALKSELEILKNGDYDSLRQFVDGRVHEVDEETASDMVLMLIAKSKDLLEASNAFIYGDNYQVINILINATYENNDTEFEKPYAFFGEDKLTLIELMEATPEKSELTMYLNQGLGLYNAEGSYYFGVDYPFYFDTYGAYVSADINEYLHILGRESRERLTVEEYLAVSVEELSKRVISYEGYLKNAKREETKEDVRTLLMVSIWKLVNPTPFDGLADENFVVNKDLMQVYQELVIKDEYPVVQEAVKGIMAFIATREDGVLGNYNDMDDLYDKSYELHEQAGTRIKELYGEH